MVVMGTLLCPEDVMTYDADIDLLLRCGQLYMACYSWHPCIDKYIDESRGGASNDYFSDIRKLIISSLIVVVGLALFTSLLVLD